MKKLVLNLLFLFIVSCYMGCSSENRNISDQDTVTAVKEKPNNLIDSLNSVYSNLGFDNYCSAVLEDEKILVEAYAYADLKFGVQNSISDEYTAYRRKVYKQLQKRLVSIFNLDPKRLSKDMMKVALSGYYECDIVNKQALNDFRTNIRSRLSLR